jgi:hypothetical protein
MIKTSLQVIVLDELKEYLVPLSPQEYLHLEESIVSEGCRDSLIVWAKENAELVLVDGHNRFKICTEKSIPYEVRQVEFSDIEEVKAWMIDNQLGRRNLNPDQLSYYRGLKYLALRRSKGGYENVKSKGQAEVSTTELLSEQFKVSESTIKRDSKFAEGLDLIGKSNADLKRRILLGEVKVKKSDIQIFSDAKDSSKIIIRNEADLLNKARSLKDAVLDDVESSIKRMESERKESAQEIIRGKEPLFLDREGRLTRIKGMILAAINKAINDKDVKAILELKSLIERLEHELFD